MSNEQNVTSQEQKLSCNQQKVRNNGQQAKNLVSVFGSNFLFIFNDWLIC